MHRYTLLQNVCEVSSSGFSLDIPPIMMELVRTPPLTVFLSISYVVNVYVIVLENGKALLSIAQNQILSNSNTLPESNRRFLYGTLS